MTKVARLNFYLCGKMISAWAGLITEAEQLPCSAFIYARRHSLKVHLFPQYQEIISLVSTTEPFWSASDRMSYSKYLAACSKVQSALFSRHRFLCFPPSGFLSQNHCRLGQFTHCWSPLDKFSVPVSLSTIFFFKESDRITFAGQHFVWTCWTCPQMCHKHSCV